MSDPFIVMSAPNGARRNKSDHGELPLTSSELAACAESIVAAGASIMHVHVRDDNGGHSLDVERYRAAIGSIRERTRENLVIQVTTEACGIYSAAEQMQVVRELRPEAVSVAMKEICPDSNAEIEAAAFYEWMQSESIMAQHILYSAEEVLRFTSLCQRGVIPDSKPFVLFVLGRYAENLTGDVAGLGDFVAGLQDGAAWGVCCFGATEHAAVSAAAVLGGHARVGFENNLLLPDGEIASDNTALVSLAAAAGQEAGRRTATAADVRGMFLD